MVRFSGMTRSPSILHVTEHELGFVLFSFFFFIAVQVVPIRRDGGARGGLWHGYDSKGCRPPPVDVYMDQSPQ